MYSMLLYYLSHQSSYFHHWIPRWRSAIWLVSGLRMGHNCEWVESLCAYICCLVLLSFKMVGPGKTSTCEKLQLLVFYFYFCVFSISLLNCESRKLFLRRGSTSFLTISRFILFIPHCKKCGVTVLARSWILLHSG